jgi:hypothetical protein
MYIKIPFFNINLETRDYHIVDVTTRLYMGIQLRNNQFVPHFGQVKWFTTLDLASGYWRTRMILRKPLL